MTKENEMSDRLRQLGEAPSFEEIQRSRGVLQLRRSEQQKVAPDQCVHLAGMDGSSIETAPILMCAECAGQMEERLTAERDAARGLAADLEAQLAQVAETMEMLCAEAVTGHEAHDVAPFVFVDELRDAIRAVLHPEPAEPSDLVFPSLDGLLTGGE